MIIKLTLLGHLIQRLDVWGGVLDVDNPYFEGMVNQIYPPELQLNKVNTSDTEAPFLGLHLSVSDGFVSSEIYDKRDGFGFDIVNFPFLDGDVPSRPSCGVYVSRLVGFARVCGRVGDFNTRNGCLAAELLKQGYRCHGLREAFSKFYCRHNELITKFNVGLKSLLQQGLSEPEFSGYLVYKLKKDWRYGGFFQSVSGGNYALQTYWIQFKCNATVCMLSY